MNSTNLVACLTMALLSAACSKDAQPPMTPANASEPEAAQGDEIFEEHPEKSPHRSQIQVSDRIREACGISERDAYFDFDSAAITPAADRVLTQLSVCFTTGPLAGQGMKLVGHADPRGDSEYNLVLGGKRADHVSAALAKKGLESEKLTATSRGEMDARGSDEAGWARDRKVEVMLAE